jgi:transcriptional regulator with XRE-family HTH domain
MIVQQLRQLESRRRQLRMSLTALSQRSGLSAPTLNRILSGEANPTLETLMTLAKALGVEIRISENGVELREPISPARFRKATAKQKASKVVQMVQGTSALESQAVGQADVRNMIEQTVHELLAGAPRRLWST